MRSSVEQRLPLGSTDLEKLLGHVDSQAAHGVLVVSDCIASTAERAAKRLGLLLCLGKRQFKVISVRFQWDLHGFQLGFDGKIFILDRFFKRF